jgi:hypothetical protein
MIYIAIIVYLFFTSIHFDFFKGRIGRRMTYIVSCIILILLAGLRYRVGGDTLNYMFVHDEMPSLSSLFQYGNTTDREYGWVFLVGLSKLLGEEFYFVQFFVAIIVNVLMFKFFYLNTKFYHTAAFVYTVFFYFYLNFEILRESIPIVIFCIYGYKLLIQKKQIKYYLLCGCLLLFHVSAVILFFIPYLLRFSKIVDGKVLKTMVLLLGIYILGFVIQPYIAPYLLALSFSSIMESKIQFYTDYNLTLTGIIFGSFVYIIIPIFIYKHTGNRYVLIYAILGSLVSYFNIFARFLNYLWPFYILALVFFIFNTTSHLKQAHGLRVIVFLLIMFIMNFEKFSLVDKENNIRWYSRWYPYISIFEEEEDSEREYLWIKQFNR